MKKMNAIVCAAITFMLPFNAFAAYIPEAGTAVSLETPGIYMDGIYMGHDGKGAFIGENGTVMIPARYIDLYVNGSYEGSEITWDDSKKEFMASVETDGVKKVISAVSGEYFVTVGGEKTEQSAANVIIDGRIYIPLASAVKYGDDCKVSYVEDSVITNASNAGDRYEFSWQGAHENLTEENIEEYIKKNIDERFSPEKFTEKTTETLKGSDAVRFVTYKYNIGDIETNFGYFAAVYDNGAEIWVLGNELYDLDESCIVSGGISMDELKRMAAEANEANEANDTDWKITGQTVEKHFVPVIGKEVYDVSTEYKNGDIVSSVLNRYVIGDEI